MEETTDIYSEWYGKENKQIEIAEQKQAFYDALVKYITIDPHSTTIIDENDFWEWINKHYIPKEKASELRIDLILLIDILQNENPDASDKQYKKMWQILVTYILQKQ